MTATPATTAQINFINNLRDGWEKFAANLATQLEDTPAYQETLAAWWLKLNTGKGEPRMPRDPNGPGTSSAFAAFAKPTPALTDEEYAAAMDTYNTAYAEWEAAHQAAAQDAGVQGVLDAQAWLDALHVDTATLSKTAASGVIDTLKKNPPYIPAA